MLSIISPSGAEGPILTKDYSITETLGNASTINASFALIDENKFGASLIQPFAKIREPTTHEEFYLDSPKVDDSGDVEVWTLTGTQKGPKELGWHYISGVIKSTKARNYKLTVQEVLEFLTEKVKHLAFQLGDINQGGTPINLDLALPEQSYPDGFGKGNALDLLKKAAKDFGFEYRWKNYTCIISRKLGIKDAFVFIDSVNCQKINEQQTYSNITTRINIKANPYKTTKNSSTHSKSKTKSHSKVTKSRYAKFHKRKKPVHKKDKKVSAEITVTATKTTKSSESNNSDNEDWTTVQVYKKNIPVVSMKSIKQSKKNKGKTTGKKTSKTQKKSGPIYQLQLTYTSPMVAKNGYPVIDHKPVTLSGAYTKAELLAKAKSLIDDQAKITITVTGANFKQFSEPKPARIQIGNQGWIKPLHGGKEQYSRITGYTKYPADNSKQDQITIGNVKLNPISWMVNERKERERMAQLYSDMQDDIYDLVDARDLQLQSDNYFGKMLDRMNDYQAQNYQLILKNAKDNKKSLAGITQSISALNGKLGSVTKK